MCFTEVEKSETQLGTAFNLTGAFCEDCLKWLTEYEFAKFEGVEGSAAESYAFTPNSIFADEGWSTGSFTYKWCDHHLTPWTYNKQTIYLSGFQSLKTKAQGPLPEAGVYLSNDWLWNKSLSNDGWQADNGAIPMVYLGWPDHGAIQVSLLDKAVKWAQAHVDRKKNLEVACFGGHGRTGTFASALLINQGRDSQTAIDTIRSTYCEQAIEGAEQLDLLHNYAAYLKGEYSETKNNSNI